MLSKILLLEDDPLFGESIQDFLEEEGFEVTLCPNGQEALSSTYEHQYDLYLFDINVPLIDGLSLLSELRGSHDQTPAIFLTSHQELTVLTEAFKNGADDYLKKPFATDELLVRIHALLRRSGGGAKEIQSVGDLSIDTQHKVVLVEGKEILLSPKEYQLMTLFIRNAGEVVTKEMITNELWSASEPSSEGAIRVYITRLKQEIGNERILNVRGLGYRLVP
ncbi:MAG: response regulator transcription factor [Sulfuricurvum sp.]|uniref:response regulator transcription factor n=1 Tax=Sulfuricurvum sp. TaxID=2025608 RepID=UPI0026220CFB|nr:response regulator transcription factor [Sulfuricurvum sp.]MDD2828670.1 response regulator transcription factor [Sulfuricurvum sp.]MDD4948347.1 response regulator transcription factor [Sulfuricurvum sp.]